MTVETVLEVFGIDSRILTDPVTGTLLLVPVGRVRQGVEPARTR